MIKLIHCLNEVKFSFHKIAVMKTNTGGSFRDAGARSVLPLAAAPVGPAGPGQQAPERQVRPRGPAGPGLLGCRASGRVSSVSSGSCLLFLDSCCLLSTAFEVIRSGVNPVLQHRPSLPVASPEATLFCLLAFFFTYDLYICAQIRFYKS